MAMLIDPIDANAWTSPTKLPITSLDAALEGQQEAEVLARIADSYNTSSWLGPTTCPPIVKKIIAMFYVGWLYQKTYSEDEDTNSYGLMLIASAEKLLSGIESGDITIAGGVISTATTNASVSFYPTDDSSALDPTLDDMSLGPAKFTMGKIW